MHDDRIRRLHLLRSPRLVSIFAVLALLLLVGTASAVAAPSVVAQVDESDQESETEQGSETSGEEEGGVGQDDPGAETDPGSGEPAEQETGPPWTYQMARIGLVLLVFLGLAIGMAYYRFVASRQRGAA
ncbi:MAG TPA: hypothetical protein VG408_09535 [Actinomycetota bacterium]|nr:hypothetical protein [Actinomycetota bacterium]